MVLKAGSRFHFTDAGRFAATVTFPLLLLLLVVHGGLGGTPRSWARRNLRIVTQLPSETPTSRLSFRKCPAKQARQQLPAAFCSAVSCSATSCPASPMVAPMPHPPAERLHKGWLHSVCGQDLLTLTACRSSACTLVVL